MPQKSNSLFDQIVKQYQSKGFGVDGTLEGYCGTFYRIDTKTDAYGLEIVKVYPKGAIEHFHEKSAEFYNLLSGKATLFIDSIPYEIEAGQPATIIAPHQRHKIVPKGEEDVILQVIAVPRINDDDHFDVKGKPLL